MQWGDAAVETPGHYITACIVASLGLIWFVHESDALCKKMEPDGYMKGIVYYYSDLGYICLCCCVLGAIGAEPLTSG